RMYAPNSFELYPWRQYNVKRIKRNACLAGGLSGRAARVGVAEMGAFAARTRRRGSAITMGRRGRRSMRPLVAWKIGGEQGTGIDSAGEILATVCSRLGYH